MNTIRNNGLDEPWMGNGGHNSFNHTWTTQRLAMNILETPEDSHLKRVNQINLAYDVFTLPWGIKKTHIDKMLDSKTLSPNDVYHYDIATNSKESYPRDIPRPGVVSYSIAELAKDIEKKQSAIKFWLSVPEIYALISEHFTSDEYLEGVIRHSIPKETLDPEKEIKDTFEAMRPYFTSDNLLQWINQELKKVVWNHWINNPKDLIYYMKTYEYDWLINQITKSYWEKHMKWGESVISSDNKKWGLSYVWLQNILCHTSSDDEVYDALTLYLKNINTRQARDLCESYMDEFRIAIDQCRDIPKRADRLKQEIQCILQDTKQWTDALFELLKKSISTRTKCNFGIARDIRHSNSIYSMLSGQEKKSLPEPQQAVLKYVQKIFSRILEDITFTDISYWLKSYTIIDTIKSASAIMDELSTENPLQWENTIKEPIDKELRIWNPMNELHKRLCESIGVKLKKFEQLNTVSLTSEQILCEIIPDEAYREGMIKENSDQIYLGNHAFFHAFAEKNNLRVLSIYEIYILLFGTKEAARIMEAYNYSYKSGKYNWFQLSLSPEKVKEIYKKLNFSSLHSINAYNGMFNFSNWQSIVFLSDEPGKTVILTKDSISFNTSIYEFRIPRSGVYATALFAKDRRKKGHNTDDISTGEFVERRKMND